MERLGSLRRRFENNQQTVSFTIMALLPTIGEHIIKGMDVEGLTNDLQKKSRATKLAQNSRPISPESQPPSYTPTDTDARSDMESSDISSIQEVGTTLGDSTQSWVDGFSLRSSREDSNGEGDPSNSLRASMIKSIGTTSTSSQAESSTSAVRKYPERLTETLTVVQPTETSMVPSKSKAELWREIKILSECPTSAQAPESDYFRKAFTRTLTTMYSIVLLSLFTHIQLSIIGRSKYIQSVLEQEEEERMMAAMSFDVSALLLGMWDNEDGGDTVQTVDPIDEETERKYLTLSWWICNIGWKDVGERVRRGVEEVFDE
jgi:peroxin-3